MCARERGEAGEGLSAVWEVIPKGKVILVAVFFTEEKESSLLHFVYAYEPKRGQAKCASTLGAYPPD